VKQFWVDSDGTSGNDRLSKYSWIICAVVGSSLFSTIFNGQFVFSMKRCAMCRYRSASARQNKGKNGIVQASNIECNFFFDKNFPLVFKRISIFLAESSKRHSGFARKAGIHRDGTSQSDAANTVADILVQYHKCRSFG